MIIFAIIMTGTTALLCGFICGIIYTGRHSGAKHSKKQGGIYETALSKEYKNFLNYDGSEQA